MADDRASRRQGARLWAVALLCVGSGTAMGGAGFGAMVEHPLSFPPAAVAVISASPGSRSEILVLAKDRPILAGHVVTEEGILVETQTFRAPDRCAAMAQGDFNGDGRREFTLLSAGGTRVHSYLRRPAGWVSRRLPSGMRATKLLSADLNSDGFWDILCYGKSMAGGIVYFGSSAGLADSAFAVLSDIPIADAIASDVNDDGVPDILVADWLANSVTLFLGLDGLTFTEALKVDVPAEPLAVDIADASPGIPAMLAVLLSDGTAIRTYSVQKAGEVQFQEELRLESRAGDLRLVDSDGNRRPELLASTASGLQLSELSLGQGFGPWSIYGLFTEPGACAVRDVDGDRKRDLVAVEGSRRRLIVCASSSAGVATLWPDVFVTAGEPVAAAISDLNRDGSNDLIVACRRPPTLAVLANDGRGMYSLAHTAGIPDNPAAVIAVSERRGGRPTVVTTHTTMNSIGVISFDEGGVPATVRSIPTGERPQVLAAARDSAGALRVLVLTGSPGGRGLSLSWFEELPAGQFVERPSGLPSSVRVVQALAGWRDTSPPVVAVLTRGKNGDGLHAWRGRAVPSAFEPQSLLSGGSTTLLAGELTRRGDFVVFFSDGAPEGTIGSTTFSETSGRWSSPVVRQGILPDVAAGSIASDLNGDGETDLLCRDKKRGMFVVLAGSGDGAAGEVRDVLSAGRAKVVAVGQPGSGGSRDLVVLHDGANAVGIIRGALTP